MSRKRSSQAARTTSMVMPGREKDGGNGGVVPAVVVMTVMLMLIWAQQHKKEWAIARFHNILVVRRPGGTGHVTLVEGASDFLFLKFRYHPRHHLPYLLIITITIHPIIDQ